MLYLSLAFGVVWACYFAYLFVVDRQVRQLHRRLDARTKIGATDHE
jgi:CcmD family protein